MSPEVKDWFQVSAWTIAIIGGSVTASIALAGLHRSNEQRREDMRWKRAEMAQRCVDEMFNNNLVLAAAKMLDWSGLTYDIPGGGKSGPINDQRRRLALRTTETVFTPGDDSPFIRDAFDALFDAFERLEQFLKINLIVFDDVSHQLSYYVEKLANPQDHEVISLFLQEYRFRDAQDFLERFPAWREARHS